MFYHYKMFFSTILMLSSMIAISANSWMTMWMGLEINLLAFIPMIQKKNNSFTSESSMKYFLTQALASVILLFSLIFLSKNFLMFQNIDNIMMMSLNSALLTKMGMAPFHFWFPEVIEGFSWMNCLILLTWQKITPLVLIMYNMNFQYFFIIIIIISMLISGIMGINQSSLRKILAYSSINHMAWMLSAMFYSNTIWCFYFIVYFILSLNIILLFKTFNIFYLNQLLSLNNNTMFNFLFSLNFLSMGGLPPFIGFLPKWLTIQMLIMAKWIFLSLIMVTLTLLTLFYYLRITYYLMMLKSNKNNYFSLNNLKFSLMIFFNISSLLSLLLFSLMFNYF